MHLRSQRFAFLILASIIACHSTTEPERFFGAFTLENINGRGLPTYLAETPGLTATIISSTLFFNGDGTVVITEDRRNFDGSETTFTNTSTYTKQGNEVLIASFWPCPAAATCPGAIHAFILGGALTVVVGQLPDDRPIVYNYRPTPVAL